jgi:hypothetical protein
VDKLLRKYARRELIFLALGTMDVCVSVPLIAVLLQYITPVEPLPLTAIVLGVILAIHYLARLALWISLRPRIRISLLGLGILGSVLLTVHQLLYAETSFWNLAWLGSIFSGLKREELSQDVFLFLLVLFLWWRGLVLAQRRLDSESVSFRFRLGVVLIAVTTGLSNLVLSWPHYHFVFIFFFASLLGMALARAEEVGQQYGGSHLPFDLGWLTTLVFASLFVLLLAVGLAALLTGENIGRLLRPLWEVFAVVLIGVGYVLGWIAQLIIMWLWPLLQFLADKLSGSEFLIELPEAPMLVPEPREPLLTVEQQELTRAAGKIGGALLLILLVVLTLQRLRMREGQRRDEVRESVWKGANLSDRLRDLLLRGRKGLGDMADALSRTLLGRLFVALTIRRIYALLGALAEEQGYPRVPHETPYEYLPTLDKAFPGSGADVTRITEAYVGVHYGELPERPEELEVIQAAWERIQAAVTAEVEAASEPRLSQS